MFSRQKIFAESGSLAAGRDINIQYGLVSTPASFSARVRRFLSYYLGSEDRPVPFGGRGVQLGQLDAWLADPGAPPNLLIAAPAGRGKTALLVRWLQSVDTARWPVAFVPISIRFETNRPDIFYQALAARLADVLGENLEEAKGDPAAVYKDKIIEQLDAFAESGKRCLLAIDGLDEATGWAVDTSVLPPEPVPGLRIIAGARVGSDSGPQNWLRRLGWRGGDTRTFEVPPLDRDGIAEVLRDMGAPLADLAGDVDLLGELDRLTEGDPLLLRFYVEDLWENRDQATGLRPEELRGREKGFGPYFKEWLDKQGGVYRAHGASFDEQTIKAILVVLACALGPLRLADLVHLVRRLVGSERIISKDSLDPIQRFLIGGPSEGGYALGHPKLGDYLRTDFFGGSEDVARAGEAFIAWGGDTVRRLNAGELAPQEAPPYLLQFYAQHLKNSNAGLEQFRELVEDGWRRAWEAYEGGFERFAGDIRAVWERLREKAARDPSRLKASDVGLGGQIRCMLCLSSIRSIGMSIPPVLIGEAVRHGFLSGKQALYLAEMQPSNQQSEAIIALAPHLPPEFLAEAFAVACAIADEASRAEALASLTPHLPPELLTAAVTVARALECERCRAHALTGLAPHLPPQEQSTVLTEALAAARAFECEGCRARALAGLAPHLPPQEQSTVLTETLAAAGAFACERDRARELAGLARYLPPQEQRAVLAEALAAARTIADEASRAEALASLTPHLPQVSVAGALAAARAIKNRWSRARALTGLAPHLAEPERRTVLADALEAANALPDAYHRAKALADLVPYLSDADRRNVLAEVLHAAEASEEPYFRALTFAAVAPYMPEPDRTRVLANALQTAKLVEADSDRRAVFDALAPQHLPAELLADALQTVRLMQDHGHRAATLASLAGYLPEPDRAYALASALEAAKAIQNPYLRSHGIAAIMPHLPESDCRGALAAALKAAKELPEIDLRADALSALAPYLSEDLLSDALETATAAEYPEHLVGAIAALAPHLPQDLLKDALEAARSVHDRGWRVHAFASIAPHLPKAGRCYALAAALEAAKAVKDPHSRAHALAHLAPHLPPEEQRPVLAEALAAARAIGDETDRGRVLVSLAPHLPPEEQPTVLAEALAAAGAIGDDASRAEALASLTPHLSPAEQRAVLAEALAAARAIGEERSRARALTGLTPHLPDTECITVLEEIIESCARLSRSTALAIVAELAPVIVVVGGVGAILETVETIRDTATWWP